MIEDFLRFLSGCFNEHSWMEIIEEPRNLLLLISREDFFIYIYILINLRFFGRVNLKTMIFYQDPLILEVGRLD